MAIGDPACDLVIAWIFLTKESRRIFRSHLNINFNTWARARGWALCKALITIASFNDKTCEAVMKQKRVTEEILREYEFEND